MAPETTVGVTNPKVYPLWPLRQSRNLGAVQSLDLAVKRCAVYRLAPDRAESCGHGFLSCLPRMALLPARRLRHPPAPVSLHTGSTPGMRLLFLYRSRATTPCTSWRMERPDQAARHRGRIALIPPAFADPTHVLSTRGHGASRIPVVSPPDIHARADPKSAASPFRAHQRALRRTTASL